jgi:hypothetical protein
LGQKMDTELLKLILPEVLVLNFDIVEIELLGDVATKQMKYEIYLDERNFLLDVELTNQYESKGFMESKRIQDFPIRGKAVYLNIRFRRWRFKEDPNKVIRNEYNLTSDGAKLTRELSDFLKGTGRYEARYDQ